ncbi:MAG TPA: Na+/H+ antiporter NhaA [Anaeromyxobacteraceae bacterium]|nr:Na+/H+ antiporter NhaA [Anaeromyxobacteraceae bacterium]
MVESVRPAEPPPSEPPEAWAPALRLARLAIRPLDRFLRLQAASGLLLIGAAAVALALANSPWAPAWARVWQLKLGVSAGRFAFERPLEWWVNDGLMAVFFFVVGLEIRREIAHGELSDWRRAALPAAAALGGMVAPALIFLIVGPGGAGRAGWGVPVATDIAFAVGVLTLLGKRVPAALRVLLLALAVIDDLGAILVIAVFYSGGISLAGLAVAAAGLISILILQWLGVRRAFAYLPPAVVAWAGTYAAGVHPTVAGVVIGMMTPVRAWLGTGGFMASVEESVGELQRLPPREAADPHRVALVLQRIHRSRREALSPAENLIESFHPWVAFVIMPVFALANSGVTLQGLQLSEEPLRALGGIALGLVLGKPLGVLLACGLVLALGLARLPAGIGARHLAVLGQVAGIGFTMSLFIANLAYRDERLLAAAKIGVLGASALAGVLGLALGRSLLAAAPGAAVSADEAEAQVAREEGGGRS